MSAERQPPVMDNARSFRVIRTITAMASHPLPRVQSAIEQLRGPEGADADRIIRRVEQSATRTNTAQRDQQETHSASSLHEEGVSKDVLSVQVPLPSLDHFNQFLSSSTQGSNDDDYEEKCQAECQPKIEPPNNTSTAAESSESSRVDCNVGRKPTPGEVEPSSVATADDEGRVRQAGAGSGGYESDVPGLSSEADGTGGCRTLEQRVELTDQTGVVPRSEGSGHLRFLGVAIGKQTEGSGAWSVRVDFAAH